MNNEEIIKLVELENNNQNNQINCPTCSNDTVIKKSYSIDLPKAAGFVVFLGASFAVILIVNAIIYLRQKGKINKLPNEIKNQIDNKVSLLGLNVPTKTTIECIKCKHVFYENYDTGDLIVVVSFFVIFLVFIILILFLFCYN
jgi:hypothetical protein